MMRIDCPQCGRGFECGATDASAPCWCVALPALPREALGQGAQTCFCPECLRQHLRQKGLMTDRQEAP
ncbi:MAG: cysteine-rich CWC family protein [Betaproteobacteria bacterium]|nr:cysteine-rich CWC family protein [Betaproteobacteria bacterium]